MCAGRMVFFIIIFDQIKKNAARMGERRAAYRILVGEPEGRNHLKDPAVDGMLILNWIFEKWDVRGRGMD